MDKIELTPKKNYNLEGFLNFSKVLKILKKSFLFVTQYQKGNIYTLIFLAIVTGVIPYLQNGFFGKLIDTTISYKNNGLGLQNIIIIVICIIIFAAVPNIVSLVQGFVETKFRFNLVRNADLYFYKKISTLDIATFESPEYQELTQKANERGTMSIYTFLSWSIDNVSNTVGVVLSFIILGFIDKTLLLYAFLGALPALYVQLRYGREIYWIWDLNSSNRRRYFNIREHFRGIIGVTELKLFQLSKRFIDEIKKILHSFDEELESAEKNKLVWELFALLASIFFLGISIWRIVNLTLIGSFPIGQMLFAYATYNGFKATLTAFFRGIGRMTEYSSYANHWFLIDEVQPKINENTHAVAVDFKNKPPKIEFKNVSFRYNTLNPNYTLENFSFIIEPGEKLAIVGLSGAGKTTLIKLLCRVYDPETGHILINGVDLKEINLDSWHRQLGVLFQDFRSYELTVKEAIAVGDPEVPFDEEKVKHAAHMAKADIFIERLPKKYDQLLWKGFEDGVELSKGEKQRMALARVFYRDSLITILDEPTASVDALAEQEIFETLEKLPDDKTVILISHRFSTVKNADNILVIEHGKLIEEGKHIKLIKEKGRYAELYKIQAESYN